MYHYCSNRTGGYISCPPAHSLFSPRQSPRLERQSRLAPSRPSTYLRESLLLRMSPSDLRLELHCPAESTASWSMPGNTSPAHLRVRISERRKYPSRLCTLPIPPAARASSRSAGRCALNDNPHKPAPYRRTVCKSPTPLPQTA